MYWCGLIRDTELLEILALGVPSLAKITCNSVIACYNTTQTVHNTWTISSSYRHSGKYFDGFDGENWVVALNLVVFLYSDGQHTR